jgi:hypothetical protein
MMLFDNSAAITWGAIGTAVGVVITLLRSFNIGISEDQENAILKFSVIVLPILVGLVVRGYVWSRHSVVAKTAEAFADGQQGAAAPPEVH